MVIAWDLFAGECRRQCDISFGEFAISCRRIIRLLDPQDGTRQFLEIRFQRESCIFAVSEREAYEYALLDEYLLLHHRLERDDASEGLTEEYDASFHGLQILAERIAFMLEIHIPSFCPMAILMDMRRIVERQKRLIHFLDPFLVLVAVASEEYECSHQQRDDKILFSRSQDIVELQ